MTLIWGMVLFINFAVSNADAKNHADSEENEINQTDRSPIIVSKPRILALNFDHTREFQKAIDDNRRDLEACGYKVVDSYLRGNESDDDLTKVTSQVSDGTLVMLTAFHSVANRTSKDLFPKKINFGTEAGLIDGGHYLERLQKHLKKSNFFLDTCYSGACQLVGSPNVATASCFNETSKCWIEPGAQTMVEKELVKILCDAVNDCALFEGIMKVDGSGWEKNPYDENNDGYLEGPEISKFMSDDVGKGKPRLSADSSIHTIEKEVFEAAKKDCEGRGLKATQKITPRIEYETSIYHIFGDGREELRREYAMPADATLVENHGKDTDLSDILVDQILKARRFDLGIPGMDVVNRRRAEGKVAIEADFKLREGETPDVQNPVRVRVEIKRIQKKIDYVLNCTGGLPVVAIPGGEKGELFQHPVFPSSFKIRCLKGLAARSKNGA